MAKAAVGVATGQHPIGSFFDCSPSWFRVATQLPQDEHRVETGMHVPTGPFDIPAAVGFLITQDAPDHLLGLRRWSADQTEIVRHVKRGSDMVAQVPVIGLAAQLMSTQRFV